MEVGEYIYHRGDTNTFIRFQDDSVNLQAGGADFITLTEASQDEVVINESSADIDFRVESNNSENMFHVDESWFYITKESFKVLLIEEMDVLIAPQTQHKSHMQKVMLLSVIGVPQVVEYEGKVCNFDGKIRLFPCAEKKPTQRRSKAGPKGTMVEVNRNVDSDFYEELFIMKGGVFDMIEKKCPWLRGQYYFLQQDGARPHTKEGLIRQLEMQVGTGEDDDFVATYAMTYIPYIYDI